MTWYNQNGKDNDVIISSRIRFARNIADYPFMSKLDAASANEIINKVKSCLTDCKFVDFNNMNDLDVRSYVEKHYISPEFAAGKLPHALLINNEKDISIMLCEEDHIRLQCIKSGYSLDEAYEEICKTDDILCDKLNIAYDEDLGFLTHCPTNLGTGMRASVMMFLPALTMTKDINRIIPQLSKYGLTIRGMYGEGTEADGCLYQISNQITLGITEEETIEKLQNIINQILFREHQARDILKSDNSDRLNDLVQRALGTLHYAYMLKSKEFYKLYADIRLGIALGYIKNLTYNQVDEMLINVMPATLMINSGKNLNDTERDKYRAEYIKKEYLKIN